MPDTDFTDWHGQNREGCFLESVFIREIRVAKFVFDAANKVFIFRS